MLITPLKFDEWLSIRCSSRGEDYVHNLGLNTSLVIDQSRFENLRKHIKYDVCPYCTNPLTMGKWISRSPLSSVRRVPPYDICKACGFWRYRQGSGIVGPSFDIPAIRRFDAERTEVSLSRLSSELQRYADRIYTMDPTRFEIFVGSILADYYDCEVHHIGRSHDDGVDLLAIIDDCPTMIQVKRRQNPAATENVDVVKLLFASAYAQGGRNGMVVTTAQRFSRVAREWANRPILRDTPFRLDLLSINDLMSIVDAVARKVGEPWRCHEEYRRALTRHSKDSEQLATETCWEHVKLEDGDVLCRATGTRYFYLLFAHSSLSDYSIVHSEQPIPTATRCVDLALRHLRQHGISYKTRPQNHYLPQEHNVPEATMDKLYSRWEAALPKHVYQWVA